MSRALSIAAADDDPRIRSFYEMLIPLAGHRLVGCAESGTELLQLCRERRPDLVVTDVRMGRMDGLQAAALINEERATPVIVVSAYEDELDTDRTGRPWICARLLKPVKEEALRRTIEQAAQRIAGGS